MLYSLLHVFGVVSKIVKRFGAKLQRGGTLGLVADISVLKNEADDM